MLSNWISKKIISFMTCSKDYIFTCPAKRKCLTFCLVSSSLWLTDWKCFNHVPYSDASKKPRIPAAGTKTWKGNIFVIFLKNSENEKSFLKISSSHYAIHAYMIWFFGGEKVFKLRVIASFLIQLNITKFLFLFFVKHSSSTFFINLSRGVTPFPTKNINFRFFKTNNFQVFSNHNVFVLKYLLHFKFGLFGFIEWHHLKQILKSNHLTKILLCAFFVISISVLNESLKCWKLMFMLNRHDFYGK